MIVPAIDIHSLFLLDKFLVLLAVILLPAFAMAARMTSLCVVGGVLPSNLLFILGGPPLAAGG
jgi:hypothetical protein